MKKYLVVPASRVRLLTIMLCQARVLSEPTCPRYLRASIIYGAYKL